MCQFFKKSLPIILLLFFTLSCSKEETSYTTELCVVKVRSDKTKYLLSDDGVILNPSSSVIFSKNKDVKRCRVTYVKMDANTSSSKKEFVIDVKYMLPVLTKEAVLRKDLTNGSFDSPVWLVSQPWASGGYLNFEFTFGSANPEIKHGIYLIQDTLIHGSNTDKICLTFGHNANGDESSTMSTALASFPLVSILNIQDVDSLVVSVLEGVDRREYKLAVTDEFKRGI